MNNILTGDIKKVLLKMSLPMMIGLLGVISLNLIDAYFIGKLGLDALAAIGYTFPAVLLQGALSGGLGVGASAVVSRAIGHKDKNLVKRLTTDSLILSLLIVIVLVVVGELTIDPLFTLMGADKNSMIIIKEYMQVWYLGLPFVVIPMVGNGAIRATGNTFIPGLIMIIAMITNSILDPIMIFGFGPIPSMGIRGAALATVISRFITMFISIIYLSIKLKMITLKLPKIKTLLNSWKNILHIGLPAALTRVFLPLSMGFITRLVSGYGDIAVAAMGMGLKIEMFALIPVMAISTVMIPFIGQNLGAGNNIRIRKGYYSAVKFSIIIGIILFIIFILFGSSIGKIFNSDKNVYQLIALYLSIASIGYGLQGIIEISSSVFNVLHKPLHASFLQIARMGVLYVPLAIITTKTFGIKGIFIAAAFSSVVIGLVSIYWINRSIKNIK